MDIAGGLDNAHTLRSAGRGSTASPASILYRHSRANTRAGTGICRRSDAAVMTHEIADQRPWFTPTGRRCRCADRRDRRPARIKTLNPGLEDQRMQMRRPVRMPILHLQQPPDHAIGRDRIADHHHRAKGEATIGTGRMNLPRRFISACRGPGSRKGRPARRAIHPPPPRQPDCRHVHDTRGDKRGATRRFGPDIEPPFRHGRVQSPERPSNDCAVSVLPWSPIVQKANQRGNAERSRHHTTSLCVSVRLPAQLGENSRPASRNSASVAWYRGRSRAECLTSDTMISRNRGSDVRSITEVAAAVTSC